MDTYNQWMVRHAPAVEDALKRAVMAACIDGTDAPLPFIIDHLQKQLPGAQPAPPLRSTPASSSAAAWTAAGWLASQEIESVLANALLGEAAGGELEAMRSLGRSEQLEELLTSRMSAAVPSLCNALAPQLRALSMTQEATTDELQTKFNQDAKGMLEYSGLVRLRLPILSCVARCPCPSLPPICRCGVRRRSSLAASRGAWAPRATTSRR